MHQFISPTRVLVLISVLLALGTLLLIRLYLGIGVVGVVLLGLLATLAAWEARRRCALQLIAERNAAELEAILESIPGMVLVGDAHGIKRTNTRTLEIQGLSRSGEEPIGTLQDVVRRLRLKDGTSGAPLKLEESPFLWALRGQVSTREFLIPGTAGGEARYLRVDAAPVRLKEEIIGAISIGIDITEQKRAEQALRVSEARFSGIISIAADAIISIDETECIVLFNHAAEEMFGYSKEEVLGHPLALLIPERLRSTYVRQVRDFASGPVATLCPTQRRPDFFGLRRTGEEFPIEAAFSRLGAGDSRLVTLILRDITERVRHEREDHFLSEVGNLLASTLDDEQALTSTAELVACSLGDCCIVDLVEEDGQVRRLTVAHRDPAKAGLADTLARMPLERRRPYLLASVMRTRRPELISEVLPGFIESIAQSEQHLQALRELNPRSLLCVPLMAHGRFLGALALISSHPRRRYGENELRLGEELAYRASLSIDHARLYRAAREATRARDDVLGVVAHDLRNPLNTIVLSAQMLLQQQPQAPLRSILNSARRMDRLIQDLLNVACMDAGQLVVEARPESTGLLLQEALEAARPLASEVQLCLEVPQALPWVRADRERLLQVFSNLLGNALKFTPRGGRVALGARVDGDTVRFWVRDTGPGIPPEALEHLFDRFWQVRRGDRRGAGLGLSIAKGLVEAHAGHIWVESEPGRGSTFFFTVPVAHPEPSFLRAVTEEHA
ncbi:MAG TPA: PAS domain-containing sensor histidine kinase [Archangium sp.]|uniref:PAS domain-containing sensor histidine kinase n=1 Tax=Archangium sp. TaxID=1872627 RepID=UPI002EDBB1E6